VFRSLSLSLLLMMTAAVHANPLEPHRWKHRLIVMRLDGEGAMEARAAVERQLERRGEGIADRELVFIDVTPGVEALAGASALAPRAAEAVRKRLELERGVEFALIGKDGGLKARQRGEFDLDDFFARIDRMPMRRAEMRREGG